MNTTDNHPTVPSSPSFLDLPAEIRRLILAKNASEVVREHYNIRAVCRTLRDDAEHVDTLSQIDLIKTNHNFLGIHRLEHACLVANNPTSVFLKAISYFMYTDERADAFVRIKHSAVVGIKPALYCYEVIRCYISPNLDPDSTIPLLSPTAIRALRRHVRQFQRTTWPGYISPHLRTIRESLDPGRIATCPCSVHRYWLDLMNENVKGHGMCHLCFWAIETAAYFHIIPGNFSRWVELSEWEYHLENAGDGLVDANVPMLMVTPVPIYKCG